MFQYFKSKKKNIFYNVSRFVSPQGLGILESLNILEMRFEKTENKTSRFC